MCSSPFEMLLGQTMEKSGFLFSTSIISTSGHVKKEHLLHVCLNEEHLTVFCDTEEGGKPFKKKVGIQTMIFSEMIPVKVNLYHVPQKNF